MPDNKDKYFNIQKMARNAIADPGTSMYGGDLSLVEGKTITGPDGKKRAVGSTLPYVLDASDNLANSHLQTIDFMHVPSETTVSFKAFVQALNESYISDWSEEPVYGRADPIRMFKQTTRTLTLSFIAPAATEGEGFENLSKFQKLVRFLYPNYTDAQNALTISQSPLVRLKVMSLIDANPARAGYSFQELYQGRGAGSGAAGTKGLLGVITNIAVNHNIDNPDVGVFAPSPGVIIPKAIEITVDFKVIHEQPLGWNEENFVSDSFPYNISMERSKPATSEQLKAAYAKATKTHSRALENQRKQERANQQLQASRDIAKSHFLNANGDLNMWGKRVQKRLKETEDAASGKGKWYRTGYKDKNKAAYYAGAMAVIGEDGRLNDGASAQDVQNAQEGIASDADALSETKWSWIR